MKTSEPLLQRELRIVRNSGVYGTTLYLLRRNYYSYHKPPPPKKKIVARPLRGEGGEVKAGPQNKDFFKAVFRKKCDH